MKKTKIVMIAVTACFLCLVIGFFAGKNIRGKYIGVEDVLSQATADTEASPLGTVNINTADADTLALLPGIGDTIAQRIVDYRRQNGDFKSVEDIKNVKGIGDAKFAELEEYITVQ